MAVSIFEVCVSSLIGMSDCRTCQRAQPRRLAPRCSADLTQTTGYKQYHKFHANKSLMLRQWRACYSGVP
jgi:hypothetical protein